MFAKIKNVIKKKLTFLRIMFWTTRFWEHALHWIFKTNNLLMGGSPGLVVMGGDWSWVRIPAPDAGWTWHFFTLICCKNYLFEKTKNKRKRGRGWPIFLKKINNLLIVVSFNIQNSIKNSRPSGKHLSSNLTLRVWLLNTDDTQIWKF